MASPLPPNSHHPLLVQSNSPTIKHVLIFFAIYLLNSRIPKQIEAMSVSPSFLPYPKYCNEVVPASPLNPNITTNRRAIVSSLSFGTGFFTGGEEWRDEEQDQEQQPITSYPKSTSFYPRMAYKTITDSTYRIDAGLKLRLPTASRIRYGELYFDLTGFWSGSTGRLCMVGYVLRQTNTGKRRSFNVVLKLNYSSNSSIYGVLVKGLLESTHHNKSNPNYFEPISILGIGQNRNDRNYEYKLAKEGNHDQCLDIGKGFLSINDIHGGLCSLGSESSDTYGLEYENECSNNSCNPFYGKVGYIPNTMYLQPLMYNYNCVNKQKIPMLLSFSSFSSSINNGFPFDPSTTLVAEGVWDEKKKRFCAVGCRILNHTIRTIHTGLLSNAVVGDCSIKISLRFLVSLSIKKMSVIEGRISSGKTENQVGYFRDIGFRNHRESSLDRFNGVRYEYTEMESVGKYCGGKKKDPNRNGEKYPDGSSTDMMFSMSMCNGKCNNGYASPLFLGDQLYKSYMKKSKSQKLMNMSYEMSFESDFRLRDHFDGLGQLKMIAEGTSRYDKVKVKLRILAEGTYDKDTGSLCMLGCQHLELEHKPQSFRTMNDSVLMDCYIGINVHFSSLNSKTSDRVKGTIESIRDESDPLYFRKIGFSSKSITKKQAKESIWRMDLEISMGLISNTLECLVLAFQLYHVRKNPNVLPFISVIMLTLLTLGHMIPLLLNFDAVFVGNRFKSYNRSLTRDGGWVDMDEALVRMVTMVAFLLEFRLFQLTWTARCSHDNGKELWVSDTKVLLISIPLYMVGGWIISWSVFRFDYSYLTDFRGLPNRLRQQQQLLQQHSLWGKFKSCGGLIRDGFLLPQILFNVLSDSSTEKCLAAAFYVGTTVVRLFPHGYDLYRARWFSWYLDWSDVYANHKADFFSTAWDVIIPCGGLLFAVVVFVQQRFGGRSIFPMRFTDKLLYEEVSTTANSEEMRCIACDGDSELQ